MRAAIALCFVACSSAALAESPKRLDIPAGRLGSAVATLGRQAGISIGVSDPALAARRSPRVSGSLTVEQALDRLLAGGGARAVSVGDRSWRIVRVAQAKPKPPRRAEPMPLPTPVARADEEIIVTASKRSAPLDSYPASVSVIEVEGFPVGAEGGDSSAIVSRLAAVTSTHLGPGRNKLFIRGLADSSFNGPTQATVGQYLGETRLNYNGPDPDLRLYDIRRIEVLQGPQGTLHGVGSLGGVLRILPVAPNLERFEGNAAAGFLTTAHGEPGYDLSGALDIPIVTGEAGLRLVGYHVRDGGYIDDRLRGLKDVNRVETSGGRAWLRLAPGGGWTVDIGAAVQSIEGDDSQYAERGAPDLSKASPIAEAFESDYRLGQFVIAKEWDTGLSLVSATGVARQTLSETYDASQPGAPMQFHQDGRISFFSNENRLAQTHADGSGWVVGTSLVRNSYRLSRDFTPLSLFRALGGVANRIEEATLFGEASFRLTPTLSVAGGGRVTHLNLSGSAIEAASLFIARQAQMKASRNETSLLPSLAFAWEPRDDLTLFLRYQESFRPGGIVVRDEFVQRYRNDDVRSLEAGLRFGRPGQGAFDAAAAVAYTRWNDIQADQIDGFGLPTTVNIGDGRILTFDARIGWRPLPGLELELAGVLADSQLTNPAPSNIIVGKSDLPNVAPVNARFGVDYATVLGGFDLRLSGWARYVGKSRLGVGPVLGEEQGDTLDTGLGARLTLDRYAVTLSATNLLDTVGNRFALGSPFTLVHQDQITPLRPRTIRIGIETAF